LNGQSLQKSLNRVWLKVVQHVVCVIETWPSPSWIARVSMPSLAGACTFAIQDARHHLCGHAICASALGDERAEAVQHAHHLHRGPLAIAARRACRGSTSSRSPGLSDLGVWMRDDGSEHDPADDDGPGRVPVKPEHEWPPLTSPCDLGQRSRINLPLTSQRACYAFRFQTATVI